MKKKWMLWKIASLALCLTMALHIFGAVVPDARATANVSSTAYTFGDASGPWRDLYAAHEKEAKQREKERKKAAKKKAAKEAREREKRENAAKKNAEKGANQT